MDSFTDCKMQYICIHLEKVQMATTKTATLTIRIEPSLKDALRKAAQTEHRSISNMMAVMIRDHCIKDGIAIENLQGLDQHQEH